MALGCQGGGLKVVFQRFGECVRVRLEQFWGRAVRALCDLRVRSALLLSY